MMLTVTVQNKEAVNKCRDTVYDIAMSEKENIRKAFSESAASGSKVDMSNHHDVCERLRYTLFQMSLGEAYQHLGAACRAIDMTDEEIASMCAEKGVTVQSAYKNAMTNMFMEVITSMMKD